MAHTVKILAIDRITHNVRKYTVEKPEGFKFTPGQATDVAINKPGWEDKTHPFTFTNLNDENDLEFIIKSYKLSEFPEHSGVTELLGELVVGDELIIDEPWGTIQYKGKGVFIAGGAGITPFIAIFRELNRKGEVPGHKLIFSNRTEKDIILKDWFVEIFKDNPEDLILTLTREENPSYKHGRVTGEFLKENLTDFNTHFYLCGPKPMKLELIEVVKGLGASVDSIVFEQ